MPNSTTPQTASKPAKPSPDFPLFPHATGRWAKKIKGSLLYFGRTADDPHGEKALASWIAEKDHCQLHGKRPAGPAAIEPRFPLFRHAGGKWAKKAKGKLLYFSKVADDPNGELALATWLAEKDFCLANGKRPAQSPATRVSTKSAKRASKPRSDFPLFPHASGWWAKKVKGKLLYFGKVADDPHGEQALAAWVQEKDYCLVRGCRPPTGSGDGVTVKYIVDSFLAHKEGRKDSGEIVQRTYDEYLATGKRLGNVFGRETPVEALTSVDFSHLRADIAKEWGPVRLANEIQRIRSIFKFAFDDGLIDKPPRYGADFKKPSAKVLRRNRAARGVRKFERDELLAVLAEASVNAKAMILLGINGGLGNSDVAWLPSSVVDLKRGWLNYPRAKTGIGRRIPLWKETIDALKEAKTQRHAPTDPAHAPLFFISRHGKSYTDPTVNGFRVGQEMQIWMDKAKIKDADGKNIDVRRKGLSFYTLRHTFQTVAEGARDLAAVQAIMGHAASNSDMSATYREGVNDERLKAVTDYVRTWLYGVAKSRRKK